MYQVPPTAQNHCSRPWKAVTFLSDGTAVCACIDAGKKMPLGNANTMSMAEIWDGEAYRSLRRDLVEDYRRRPLCVLCPNRIAEAPADPTRLDGLEPPRHVYIETVAACNLTCPGCDRNEIEGSRTNLVMSSETFKKIVDGLSPHLEYLEYHVGGENWAHKDSSNLIRYAKDRNPHCFIASSTNGLYFNDDKRRRAAVASGVDLLIFSVDGARAESYLKYRVGGDFDQVVENMREMIRIRDEQGLQFPKIVWRYILFPWNDSDEEMDEARRMAKELKVDALAWHLNAAPDPFFSSARFRHGSPHLEPIRHELWDTIQAAVPVNPQWGVY
jgi:pyruvate-formate lyase-activating enzyme